LWFRARAVHSPGASDYSMGEAEGPGRGRADGNRAIMGKDVRHVINRDPKG
jgi:hypothetical protein